eukprot:4576743-Pyramimonas_sp.AAC.1
MASQHESFGTSTIKECFGKRRKRTRSENTTEGFSWESSQEEAFGQHKILDWPSSGLEHCATCYT